MAKKRMILEEIEEPVLAVTSIAGSPDNPIKLSNKAKTAMLRLSVAEQQKEQKPTDSWWEGNNREALDVLLTFGLAHRVYVLNENQRAANVLAIQKLREKTAHAILSGDSSGDFRADWVNLEAANRDKIWRLTDAGKALIISGEVTVKL